MYLMIWIRRAGLLVLALLGPLVAGILLAGIGSQSAAAQDNMAVWMYMPPRVVAGVGALHLEPAHAPTKPAATALSPVDRQTVAATGREAVAAMAHGPDPAITTADAPATLFEFLRPAHSPGASQRSLPRTIRSTG